MKIGVVTIGQSPRDDIIPEIREILGSGVEIIEVGALDGLSLEEVKDFYPEPTDFTLVTRMKDGTEVKVAEKYIIPRLNNCISGLEAKDAEILMLLYTGEFQGIKSKRILLRPDRLLGNIGKGILEKGRLGFLIKPDQRPPIGTFFSYPPMQNEVFADCHSVLNDPFILTGCVAPEASRARISVDHVSFQVQVLGRNRIAIAAGRNVWVLFPG